MRESEKKGKRRNKKVWYIIAGVVTVLVVVWLIICPPGKGEIKPFLDEKGNEVKGSIAEKTQISINGTQLGIFLRGIDETKPVLLFLAGGPGMPQYLLEELYPTGIDEKFVVCWLEYRGTSLSYDSHTKKDTMTTKQYMEDVVAVTNYLKERFGQEKIYLMAHSFGTYIGLNTVSLHPELYHAYIAMSQITDQRESEYLAADYMEEQYRIQGNKKKVKAFEKCAIRESEENYKKYFTSLLRDTSMHELGIGTARDMNSLLTGIILPTMRCKSYTPMERINIFRGKFFAQSTQVAHDAWDFSAFDSVKEVKIPIYFLGGIHDYTCCYSLQKKYYDSIKAPLKAFYSFQNSAHSPLYEEPEYGMRILVEDVMNGTINLADKNE